MLIRHVVVRKIRHVNKAA